MRDVAHRDDQSKLGIKTIAEGVETEAQQVLLIQFGCDYIQGFLYSKPVTATEFMQLLQD
jgi:EAL domain-containing protein (putative c-di-GMP-specific phosphodiesterase class I)